MTAKRTTKRVSITGRNELVRRINELTADMSGADRAGARAGIMKALGDGANVLATEARTTASAAGVPADVIEGIFSYGQLPAALKQRKKPSSLAGVSKQKSMREWRAANNPKSPRAKVSPGGKVAMSLAAMFEHGTSRMPGLSYFSRAVTNSRSRVRGAIEAGLLAILREYQR